MDNCADNAATYKSGQEMYVLQFGNAGIYLGDFQVVEASVGSILNEMALIDDMPRAATVIALTDCKFTVLDEKEFYALLREAPFFCNSCDASIFGSGRMY